MPYFEISYFVIVSWSGGVGSVFCLWSAVG